MPFFRDEEAEDDFLFERPQSLHERIETARWLHWCGWYLDAQRLLHSIAKSIQDEDPRQEETLSYEETRFNAKKDKTERSGRA